MEDVRQATDAQRDCVRVGAKYARSPAHPNVRGSRGPRPRLRRWAICPNHMEGALTIDWLYARLSAVCGVRCRRRRSWRQRRPSSSSAKRSATLRPSWPVHWHMRAPIDAAAAVAAVVCDPSQGPIRNITPPLVGVCVGNRCGVRAKRGQNSLTGVCFVRAHLCAPTCPGRRVQGQPRRVQGQAPVLLLDRVVTDHTAHLVASVLHATPSTPSSIHSTRAITSDFSLGIFSFVGQEKREARRSGAGGV